MGGRSACGDTGRVPPTVLVVDDDADFRNVARRLLTRRGLLVVADVASGEAAIEAVRRHRPDGVLLDVNLPDRDGLSVTRALVGRSDAPSIVLTSMDALRDPDTALAACGARAFVAKERLAEADLLRLFSPAGT
jgi:two-component system nitrate/nitrite response regulator NarL